MFTNRDVNFSMSIYSIQFQFLGSQFDSERIFDSGTIFDTEANFSIQIVQRFCLNYVTDKREKAA